MSNFDGTNQPWVFIQFVVSDLSKTMLMDKDLFFLEYKIITRMNKVSLQFVEYLTYLHEMLYTGVGVWRFR